MTFFRTRDGTRIFYKDWGTGPPILFSARKAVDPVPGAELKIYRGGSHGLAQIQAAKFNDDLLRFIGGPR